ncbi:MAG: glycoside hydrolase domain-containing protein [Terracidiphilus sp.]
MSYTKRPGWVLSLFLLVPGWGAGRSAQAQSIQDMHLFANQSGWLLADARLFWTDTLGVQWTEITPPAADGSTIAGVSFDEAGNGWVFSAPADQKTVIVARTADRGAHWSDSTIASPFDNAHPFGGRAYASFANAQQGWVIFRLQSSSAFRPGLLFHTEDGGAHWSELPQPPVGGDLVFTDALHGWMGPGPEGDELYRTSDGGQSWQRVELPAPAGNPRGEASRIGLPKFQNLSEGLLLRTYIGDKGATVVRYETRDAGVSWRPATAIVQNTAGALAVVAADGTVASRIRAQIDGSRVRLPLSHAPAGPMLPQRATFATESAGWVLFAGGSCEAGTGVCTHSEALLGTQDGGQTFFTLGAPPGIALETTKTIVPPKGRSAVGLPRENARPRAQPESSFTVAGAMGFDTCVLMTTSQMQTWYAASPYRVVGAYIGGDSFACPSSLANFTAGWTATVLGMGWEIIPIWVGPQAPGGNYTHLISTDPATANSEGVTEADSAVAAMLACGMNQGSPIVYDMEAYSYNNATDVAATQSFLEGWTTELHAKGYFSAVYSSYPEFNNWLPSLISPATDDIWFAYFFNSGVPCGATCQTVYPAETSSFTLPSNVWTNHHRMRQTSSGFESTYGTLTYNIDEDWIDAAMVVATPNMLTVTKSGTGTGTIASAQIGSTGSADVSLDTQIACGSTCSANFAATDIVTLEATPDAGSAFDGWSGCDTVSSDQCTVTVSSSRTVAATFTANAPAAATPAFSPAAGTYGSAQMVSIGDATPGATIYYTTNGTTPTTASTPYTAPIQVSSSETIEAIAIANGYAASAVASAAYIITPPGFSATVSAPALTIKQGQSGVETLTVTPQGAYTGTLSFSCSGLPGDASCSFNPPTLTATGNDATLTATLTIATTMTSAGLVRHRAPFELVLLLPFGLLPFTARRKRARGWFLLIVFALCGLSLTALAGCGGGGAPASGGSSTIYAGTVNLVITSSSGQTKVPIQLTITQ